MRAADRRPTGGGDGGGSEGYDGNLAGEQAPPEPVRLRWNIAAELPSHFIEAAAAAPEPNPLDDPVLSQSMQRHRKALVHLTELGGSAMMDLRKAERTADGLSRFLRVEHGTWAIAVDFPDWRPLLDVSPAGVDLLAYVPVDEEATAAAIESVTVAAALARVNRLDPDRYDIVHRALFEDVNPTVAILAASAWDRRGETDRIDELAASLIARYGLLPYDIAQLASDRDWMRLVPVPPGFPLLARGWYLLEDSGERTDVMALAERHLLSSPWTAFDERLAPAVIRELAGAAPASAVGGYSSDASQTVQQQSGEALT